MNRLRPVAKWMLGGLFCLSALLKLRSIDSFELYLFSFGVVSFDGCSLLARLLIGAEAMLGAMFLTGWHHRLLCRLYAAVLAGFSLWLLFLLAAGEEGHCRCFGEAVVLDAPASLLKNLLLALMLAFVWRMDDRTDPPRLFWIAGGGCALFLLVFLLSPPDRFLRARHRSTELVPELYAPVADSLRLDRGRRMVCLYSPGCRYCRLTARKVAALWRRHELDPQRICCIFMRTESEMTQEIDRFFDEYGGRRFPRAVLDPRPMLDLCNGALPLVLLTEEGRVVAEYGFRTLDEAAVVRFLTEDRPGSRCSAAGGS